MEPVPHRVTDVLQELSDCFTLTLDCNAAPFAFAPGQFNMLYVFGHGEVPISLSGDPSQPGKLAHTIRNVGSITAALQRLKAGDTVGVRGPFGSSWPLEHIKGRDVIVMAGGLGLAPLRPALYHLLANREDYGTVTLLYGTRMPNTVLFTEELKEWSEKISVSVTVDSAGKDWRGDVGVITDLLTGRQINAASTVAFVCGPEIMMRFCAHALLDKGLSPADIYVSMERNMKCAIGQCGRCQYGPYFICHDGPIFSFEKVRWLFGIREV
ncbi:MAG: FAD/NAD(P)-binding protein [Rickettsiales bacterium]|nr:FAD/NAD(P)-binding protein [Rickettsiales bacterium]